jgi:hypothetical protein
MIKNIITPEENLDFKSYDNKIKELYASKFKKYKIPINKETMEDFCLPKKFKLQPQQKMLADILSSKYSPWELDKNIRGILLYHDIGAGKTCTVITIAEELKKKLKIVVVLPAALVGNFMFELKSECTGDTYVTINERNTLKKLNILDEQYDIIHKKIESRIKSVYTIYSYHKFIALIQNNKLKNLNNCLLIIDEVQNMISLDGIFYKLLKQVIDASNDLLKIILLSATPMFDKPVEIALTLNLLKKSNLLSISKFNQNYINVESRTIKSKKYKTINMRDFKNKIRNIVSYYRGAPPQAYPNKIFKKVKCNMSDFQYKSYLTCLSSEKRGTFKNVDILNMPQNFLLGPRMISNIAFPNKSVGEQGFSSFKGDVLQMQNISTYSIKFYKIFQKINQSIGPVFVYSNFKDVGGIRCFVKFLEYHGWKNYMTHDSGLKRFAVWSGDESQKNKEKMKYIFNLKTNINGNNIKIMLGSPSIKEGVSLLRVEQVHIMEPYWNMSRLLQIMGRAIRFCSHKDVPKKRRVVTVYLYLTIHPNIKESIDQYIWSIAQKKNKLITQFELALKESAFDCELLYNRNYYPTDEIKLKCE